MRVLANRAGRLGDAHASSSSIAFARACAGSRPWTSKRFGDLVADREDRVERRHRLLEDEADLAPRTSRISRSSQPSRSRPLKRIGPPLIRPGGCTSRRIDSAVTDLPLPDSPTMPSVSPGAARS